MAILIMNESASKEKAFFINTEYFCHNCTPADKVSEPKRSGHCYFWMRDVDEQNMKSLKEQLQRLVRGMENAHIYEVSKIL